MKVLVTGANGQLGFDVVTELDKRGHNAIGVDIAEMDITDKASVKRVMREIEPDVVIHCASWTAVDKAEQYSDIVHDINVLGTEYIAEECKELDAVMIFISTDYVFDGSGDKPHDIADKRKGLSVYGISKVQGEDIVTGMLDKYYIVRTTWAFGRNGNNFVKTMLRLADSGKTELNVVDDQIGSPTYTPDLARLLVDMSETNKFGIYHATNEGFCSCYEFACEIFRQTGKNIKVNPVTTEEYLKLVPQQATRPLNSRLDKSCLVDNGFEPLPFWKDSLRIYLKTVFGYGL